MEIIVEYLEFLQISLFQQIVISKVVEAYRGPV